MAPGRIIPARISSTVTQMFKWLDLRATFLPGIAGSSFKILFQVCFVSAALGDSLHWMVQSCASGTLKVGQGLDQHLFEAVEHMGAVSGECDRGAQIRYREAGERRRSICNSDTGEKEHCSIATCRAGRRP